MSKPEFYVGQEVECLVHGNGKIFDISTKKDAKCPIYVHFEKGGLCMYSAAGEASFSAGRTLYAKGSITILPNFYLGQEVECVAFGNGKVVHIFNEKGAAFPVQVIFESGVMCMYSYTGKMSISAHRTLYAKGSIKVLVEE